MRYFCHAQKYTENAVENHFTRRVPTRCLDLFHCLSLKSCRHSHLQNLSYSKQDVFACSSSVIIPGASQWNSSASPPKCSLFIPAVLRLLANWHPSWSCEWFYQWRQHGRPDGLEFSFEERISARKHAEGSSSRGQVNPLHLQLTTD